MEVTVPTSLGGSGNVYSDALFESGEHVRLFIPALSDVVALTQFGVDAAADAQAWALTALNAPGTLASATGQSRTIPAAAGVAMTINIQPGKSITPGMEFLFAAQSNPLKRFAAIVTSYNVNTGALGFTSSGAGAGAGESYSDWWLSLSATSAGAVPSSRQVLGSGAAAGSGGALTSDVVIDVPLATIAEIRAMQIDGKVVTPLRMRQAMIAVDIPFAAVLNLDLHTFIDANIGPATSDFSIPNPTNVATSVGKTGAIRIPQDATGNRKITSWGSYWKRPGGVLSLSPGANAQDTAYYRVRTATEIEVNMTKAYA